MKKILVLAAAIALVSSTAFAAGSANLVVTANVTATCSITGGTLAFGALDPLVGGAVGPIAAAGVQVTCSNGTPFTVTDDSISNPLLNGASTIPFTLTHLGTGTGTGLAVPYAIAGNIAAGSYVTALAGAYTSNVTLTVTP
jgi:spore coat protein U-like protein